MWTSICVKLKAVLQLQKFMLYLISDLEHAMVLLSGWTGIWMVTQNMPFQQDQEELYE